MFYNLRYIYSSFIKKGILNNMESYIKIENRAAEAEKIISFLKSEIKELQFHALKNQAANKIKPIKEENEVLKKEIILAKNELINLQLVNGVKQVQTPDDVKQDEIQEVNENIKAKREVKTPEQELPVNVSRLDIRVGYVVDCKKHPQADTLYVLQVDCGEDRNRTVVSGLVNSVPINHIQDNFVVLLCNLKPAKLRGILSEAMVMCACLGEKIELLKPPSGSVPGDIVSFKGYDRNPDAVLHPKKKIFETVAANFSVNTEKHATYKDVEWSVSDKGFVRVDYLIGASIR